MSSSSSSSSGRSGSRSSNGRSSTKFQAEEAKGLRIDERDTYIESRELRGEGLFYVAHKYVSYDTNETYEIWVDQDGDVKIVEPESATKRFQSLGYK